MSSVGGTKNPKNANRTAGINIRDKNFYAALEIKLTQVKVAFCKLINLFFRLLQCGIKSYLIRLRNKNSTIILMDLYDVGQLARSSGAKPQAAFCVLARGRAGRVEISLPSLRRGIGFDSGSGDTIHNGTVQG
jgi:hypothetical protein